MSIDAPPRLPTTFNRLACRIWRHNRPSRSRWPQRPSLPSSCSGAAKAKTGLLQTALTLPFILFAIPAGLLADRISRRRLMAGSEGMRAAALAAILVLIPPDWLTLPLLALLGFVAVRGTVAYSVATPALVPSLVPPESCCPRPMRELSWRAPWLRQRPGAGRRAGGMDGCRTRFRRSRRPLRGRRGAACRASTEPARAPAPRRHPLQEIKEGAAFVLGYHPLLRPVFITQFIFNTASFLLLAVFVPYAVRRLGLSATGVGSLHSGMYGVGMVVGALLATRLMRRLAFLHRDWLSDPFTGFVAACVMALTTFIPIAGAGGLGLLPAWRRPDPVGDLDRHVSVIGDAAPAAGTCVRDQHIELWRAPGRLGARRPRRRVLQCRNRSLPCRHSIFGVQALVILLSPAASGQRGSRRWWATDREAKRTC